MKKALLTIFTIASLLLLFVPVACLLTQAIISMVTVGATVMSISILSAAAIIFGIITIIGIARRTYYKSSIWVLILAALLITPSCIPALIVIGICSLIEDILINPMIEYYKE